MAIARTPTVVIDCPDPGALARFYGGLLDFEVSVDEDDSWAEIRSESWPPICFQQVADHQRPQWPGQEHPQQFHLDVAVDDIDAAEPEVLALGASRHEVQPSENGGFRVYLDPAGHPFCLCRG